MPQRGSFEERMRFVFGNQGSLDSEHSEISPIFFAKQFLPSTVRLIRGRDELLLRTEITGRPDITVGFGKRNPHIAQGEWEAVTLNEKNRCVLPFPNFARLYKIGGYSSKMGEFDLEVSATHADFGGISEVWEVSGSRQERRKNRMNDIESAFAYLIDMSMGYITK